MNTPLRFDPRRITFKARDRSSVRGAMKLPAAQAGRRCAWALKAIGVAIAIACSAVPVAMAQDTHFDAQSRYGKEPLPQTPGSAAPLFPHALRVEPGLVDSKQMFEPIRTCLTLMDAGTDGAKAIRIAEELAADPRANRYDRAILFQAMGAAYVKQGEGAKGLMFLQKSLDADVLPNDVQYTLLLQVARTQLAIGRPDAGLKTMARLVAETGDDKPEYDAIRARMFYLEKDYGAAARALQKSIDGSKIPDPDEQTMLLHSYLELGQTAQAEKVGADIVAAHPDNLSAVLNLATLYRKDAQADKERALLDAADRRGLLTPAADDRELDAVRGRMFYLRKDYADAAHALQQSIDGEQAPDPGSQAMLLDSYFELRQTGNAERVGLDILGRHPNDRTAVLNLAAVYQQAGQSDQELALLEDAHRRGLLATSNDYRQLYVLYAHAKGHDDDCVALINEGLQNGILRPDAEVYSILGADYFFADQDTLAIDAYRKADAASADGEAALNLAKIYSIDKRAAEARDAARRALHKGVKYPEEADRLIARAEATTGK